MVSGSVADATRALYTRAIARPANHIHTKRTQTLRFVERPHAKVQRREQALLADGGARVHWQVDLRGRRVIQAR